MREIKDTLCTILSLLAMNFMKWFPISSHHNSTPNFCHSPYKNKTSFRDLDQEIKTGKLRLRCVKLLRDFHTTHGEEGATDLIKESMAIWERLSEQKNKLEY